MWDGRHGTVLSMAAMSGSKDTFEAAVAALEDNLTPAEVMVEGFTGFTGRLCLSSCNLHSSSKAHSVSLWDRNMFATIRRPQWAVETPGPKRRRACAHVVIPLVDVRWCCLAVALHRSSIVASWPASPVSPVLRRVSVFIYLCCS